MGNTRLLPQETRPIVQPNGIIDDQWYQFFLYFMNTFLTNFEAGSQITITNNNDGTATISAASAVPLVIEAQSVALPAQPALNFTGPIIASNNSVNNSTDVTMTDIVSYTYNGGL